MTREQAKHRLLWIQRCTPIHTRDDARDFEALEMAIQALSQEPTEEEQALLQKWRDNRGISIEEFEDAMNALQEPCDDIVSRQAVIYYIKGHIHEIITESGTDKNAHTNSILKALINGVETMPAVNPQPCDDAISRKDIQDYIAKYLSQYLYEDVRQAVEVIDAYIGDMPSVTQKSETVTEFADRCRECGKMRKGHWIWNFDKGYCKCSECGIGMGHKEFDYCPNCGARMESEDKE